MGESLAVSDCAELLDGGPMPERTALLVSLAGISSGVADPASVSKGRVFLIDGLSC
jgi:hypothetical protein